MSPRRVRRKYVRHLIVWPIAILPIVALGFVWPLVWVIFGILAILLGGIFAGFYLICTIIATAHFLSTGYWTNPLRHGPWGDWKGEF